MSKKKDREFTVFSLSFLDCISCGFGAVLLLFVLTLGAGPTNVPGEPVQQTETASEAQLQEWERVKQETEAAQKELEEQIARTLALIQKATLEEERLSTLMEAEPPNTVREKAIELPQPNPTLPIGVPVDSNHLIIIIDTSGSMRDPRTGKLWDFVINRVEETLDAYPVVEKIQVLDADGRPLIVGTKGQWLKDSPTTRKRVGDVLRLYTRQSQSNPVPAIVTAIQDYGYPLEKNKKTGIYIFGDEFTQNAQKVLDRIEALNPPDAKGDRPITINAVGFPHVVKKEYHPTQTGLKFANLMRELTRRHGGAFIGMEL